MPRERKRGRWSVEQRLEFIDFRLYWEGRVNRSDLVEHFGVSVPQASVDLTQYQAAAKHNAVYDKTQKAYVAGPNYRPIFFKPSADGYLAQLRLLEAKLWTAAEAWAIPSSAYSIVPPLRRHIDPNTLRAILGAIRDRLAVKINYQAVSRPESTERWVSPHALAFDGYRWHMRVWCHKRNGFQDFVLARILSVGETRASDADHAADAAWMREITLRFEPHPDLKGGARKAIELDFGMVDGAATITTRVCLTYYLERHFGLDVGAPKAAGHRQQIVLVNRAELDAARAEIGMKCEPDSGTPSPE